MPENPQRSSPAAPQCLLFVPGNRPERFEKAHASGADGVILDLEDAVSPEHKSEARDYVVQFLQVHGPAIVRVNAATTPWFAEDLAALSHVRTTAIMLPKAQDVADIVRVAAVAGPSVRVIALIESALGLDRLAEILAVPAVWFAAFGSIDMSLDLGCADTWEALLFARSRVVLQSRLAGLIAPFDGVTPTVDDPMALEADARRASALGFRGKLAIHPRQVEPILNGFTPDAATQQWAKKVLAKDASGNALKIDGAMVDRPIVERARRILESARRRNA